jgi:hypothetical protein
LKKLLYWVLFIILLLLPIVINFVFINNILNFAQRAFIYYRYTTADVLLKDILFTEGAVLLIFGCLIGGVIVYNAWAHIDVRKAQFTDYIWNWKKIREERNYPTGLMVGLTLIAFGIVYVLVAILFPSFAVH